MFRADRFAMDSDIGDFDDHDEDLDDDDVDEDDEDLDEPDDAVEIEGKPASAGSAPPGN